MEYPKVKLGEVCEINPAKKVQINDWDEVTFLAMADISESGKILNRQTRKYIEVKKGFTSFKENDILIAKITPCFENGKASIANELINETGFGSTEFHVIRPGKHALSSYVFYSIRTSWFAKQGKSNMTGSAGQQRVPTDFLRNYTIPLPPLETQRHIAAVLDRADAVRQQSRQLIAHYDELIQSVFLDMFGDPVRNEKGWEVKSLKSISDKFSDGPFGSNLKSEHYRPDGIRVVRLGNIGIGKFLEEDQSFVSEDHYEKVLKRNTCLPGDVIIGTMGDPNLRACILPRHIPVAINKADCIVCRPKKSEAQAQYVSSLLNFPTTINLASAIMHGQTRVRISMGQLAEIGFPIPPLSLQTHFANVVEQIDGQKATAQAELAQAEALFESLLTRAFRGELALAD